MSSTSFARSPDSMPGHDQAFDEIDQVLPAMLAFTKSAQTRGKP
jgi:hypothetical protein